MGPDQIPNIVLKTCAKTLAPGMTKIFQKSIDCSELPDDWLSANVAPVYKKGDVHKAENYRPVSLRDQPFNLKEGGLWCFVSFRIFYRTTQELEYFFFVAQSANFFFQNSTLGYMTKTLNQIIFFSSTKIRIFFSATLGIRIFF